MPNTTKFKQTVRGRREKIKFQQVSPSIIICWLKTLLDFPMATVYNRPYIDGHDYKEIRDTKYFQDLKCLRCGYISRAFYKI